MSKILELPMPNEVQQAFQAVFLRIYGLLHASESVLAGALDDVPANSAVGKANGKNVRDPYEQARLLFLAIDDHLRSILFFFEHGPLPMFALYSLLRPAAEAVVRCAYLLDDSTDETGRLARGLNVRIENLLEQHKIAKDQALLDRAFATIEQKAATNGIVALRKSPTSPLRVGEPRLKETALFARFIPPHGEELYRFLSAHVHSMPWVRISKDKAVPTGEPGVSSMPQVLDMNTFAGAAGLVLRRHEANIQRFVVLAGYPLMVWTEAMKSAKAAAQSRLRELAERQSREKGAPQ
ncbi:MAG: hypothetical protein KGN00_10220 [Chloroflexota bacterium]|nr:hypothetical protein [Chloroflexota bacterium]